jgi:hypothetical protein
MPERRAASRVAFPRRATVIRRGKPQPVVLRDFSPAGIRVDLRSELALGARYRFEVRRDDDRPVVIPSTVHRIDPDGGAFLRFEDVDTDALRSLGRIFAALESRS